MAPAQTAPAQTSPAQTSPAQTAPAQASPAQTAPAQTAPAQTSPAQASPTPASPAPATRRPARRGQPPGEARPYTFYLLAALMAAFLLFLYGPMLVIYVLSFQGPNGGVTFPMVGASTKWFTDIVRPGQMADIPAAFERSIALSVVVSLLTVVISVAAGMGFRRRFPGAGLLFYIAIASLVMPSLLVGFGIGLGFTLLDLPQGLFTSALGAQLTWTLPFGLLTMFAVFARFPAPTRRPPPTSARQPGSACATSSCPS